MNKLFPVALVAIFPVLAFAQHEGRYVNQVNGSASDLTLSGTTTVSGTVSGATDTVTVAASDTPDDLRHTASFYATGTADQVTIQAAISALPAGGGEVRLLNGTFAIADSVNLAGGKKVSLTGQGPATILALSSSNAAISAVNTSGSSAVAYAVNISNLRITGTAGTGDGINLSFVDRAHINGVITDGVGRYGISVGDNAFSDSEGDIIIRGCHIMNSGSNGIQIHTDAHDVLISSTHIEGSGGNGLTYLDTSADLMLVGCQIEDQTLEAVWINAPDAKAKLVGNTFQSENSNDVIKIEAAQSVVISNNTIDGGTRGIRARGDSGDVIIRGLVISGNSFVRQTASAASIGNPGDTIGEVAITGNVVSTQNGLNGYGFFVNFANQSTITGNSIYSNGPAVSVQAPESVTISGNSLGIVTTGTAATQNSVIVVSGTSGNTYVSITGNFLKKVSGAHAATGVNFVNAPTAAQLSANMFLGLDTEVGGTTTNVLTSGTSGYDMRSPDGNRWRIAVSDIGGVSATDLDP